MSTFAVATVVIAVYGAALATFTFAAQQFEKRRRVKVTLSRGFIAQGPSNCIDIISLEAANAGQVPVHLSSCYLSLPEAKEKFISYLRYSREFPVTLNPGESVEAWIESEKFIEIIRKSKTVSEIVAVAIFSNKGGGVFRSKAEKFVLDDMLFAKEHVT